MRNVLIIIIIFVTSISYAQSYYSSDHTILLDISGSMDEDIEVSGIKTLIKKYIINEALLHQGDRITINTFCKLIRTDNTVLYPIFCGNYTNLDLLKNKIDEDIQITGNNTDLVAAMKKGVEALGNLKNIPLSTPSEPRLKIIWLFTDNRHHLEDWKPVNTTDFYRHLDETEEYRRIYFFPIIPGEIPYGFILYAIMFSTNSPSIEEIKCFDSFIMSVKNAGNNQSFHPVLFKPIGEDVLKVIFKKTPEMRIEKGTLVLGRFKADKSINKEIEFTLKSQFDGWIVKNTIAKMDILEELTAPNYFEVPASTEIGRNLMPERIPPNKNEMFRPGNEITDKYRVKIAIPWVKSKYDFFDSFTQDTGRVKSKMGIMVDTGELVPACMEKIHESEKMVRPIVANTQLGKMNVDFIIEYPPVYFYLSILLAVFVLLLFISLLALVFFLLSKELSCRLTIPDGEVSFPLSLLRGYTVNDSNRNLGKIKMDILGGIRFFPFRGITINGKQKPKRLDRGGDSFELMRGEECIPIFFEVQKAILTPVAGEEDIF